MPKTRKNRDKKPPKEVFNVRLSDEQRADVKRAAELVASERGVDEVPLGSLFREIGMRGVREILAKVPA